MARVDPEGESLVFALDRLLAARRCHCLPRIVEAEEPWEMVRAGGGFTPPSALRCAPCRGIEFYIAPNAQGRWQRNTSRCLRHETRGNAWAEK